MSVGRRIARSQTVAARHARLGVSVSSGWQPLGFALAVFFVSVFSVVGCGPAPSASHSSTSPPSSSAPAAPAGAGSTAGREPLAAGERVVAEHTDAQGRKWLGDVPYDVFYDDPLAVAAEGRTEARSKGPAVDSQPKAKTAAGSESPSNASAPIATNNRGGTATVAAPGGGKPAGSSTDWPTLIDADTLDGEVKHIRTDLTAGLQSVAKYNAHYQEIAVSGATLAALAEIVAEAPGAASWKQHASSVRDLAASIHDSAKALGGPAFQATKNSSDQLVDVLDGNVPAGLAASEPIRDFSQVANRSALMKRMDRSYQRLKKGGTAQQLLKKDAGQAIEDAAMLAVLSRVIAVGHYESADDPKYRGHSTELTRSATDLATAAKSGEAPAFADALTRIQKRCDACHADFRF